MVTVLNGEYFTDSELKTLPFRAIGVNIRVARNSTIVGIENIEIADNVRIDSYCTLVAADGGYLRLGSFIHIGGYCYLGGSAGIVLQDFSNLSQGVRIYSQSDDYTGKYMTNPTIPAKYTGCKRGQVTLHRHVIIGSGSVILPAVTIGEGSAVGALSVVAKSLDPWGIYAGCPVRRLRPRSQRLLELEKQMTAELSGKEHQYDNE